MPTQILVDAGPLVAWLIRGDQHYHWATEEFARLESGLLTCEAVVCEASLLIEYHGGDPAVVTELVSRRVLKIAYAFENDASLITSLMRRYKNVPMSFADACLVRMSEIYEDCQIFTTDLDFTIYRRFGRKAIPLILGRKH